MNSWIKGAPERETEEGVEKSAEKQIEAQTLCAHGGGGVT